MIKLFLLRNLWGDFMDESIKKCLIIYNPKSGKGLNPKILDEYKKILHEYGYSIDVLATQYRCHATDAVRTALDYDVIFSVGGDGTLNEVVSGNYQRDNKLVICPLPNGTCNDVATMLGYSTNPISNLKKALDGEIHLMDIGTINEKPFVYVVGGGKFLNIPYETKSEEKKKDGYLAYIKAGISELLNKVRRYRTEVEIDGVKLDGKYSLIMISNANHIAGINGFHKDVCLDDGLMEVVLCKSKNIQDFAGNFIMHLMGQKCDDIISLKAREVKVKMLDRPEKKWCIDGEELKYDGNDFTIKIGDKMPFLTPKIKSKKLFSNDVTKI